MHLIRDVVSEGQYTTVILDVINDTLYYESEQGCDIHGKTDL